MADLLRVLFVGHEATRSGAPAILLQTLKWIRQNRKDIDFEILLRCGGELESEFCKVGPVLLLEKYYRRTLPGRLAYRARTLLGPFSPSNPSGLQRYYRRRGIGLVYSNTVVNDALLPPLARLGCPVICHVHEMEHAIRQLIGVERFTASSKFIDHYIAVSEAVRRNLTENHGVPESRTSLVYEFIPVGKAVAGNETRADFLRRHGVPPDAIVVGGCGTVVWHKGPDLFVQAAYHLRKRHPDRPFVFLWAGGSVGDALPRQLQFETDHLGLSGTVRFLGALPDPAAFFQAVDVFLVSSREDSFPLVMLEAALAGKPVVCFAGSGGAPEFVGADCGWVVPYADTVAAGCALYELGSDAELRERLGRSGKSPYHSPCPAMCPENCGNDPFYLEAKPVTFTAESPVVAKGPSVHIVLLNWNGLGDTVECLKTLQNQTYARLTVHVVDQGSTRDEAGDIERLFPNVNVIRACTNLGFCAGNNVGIRAALEAGADYLLLLNNDTIAPPTLLEDLLTESADLGRVGAVCPVILCHPAVETVWFAGADWEAKVAGFRHRLFDRPVSEVTAPVPYVTDYASGCCLLISAHVIGQVGLLDPAYFAYYDEADWCSRMQRVGLCCYVIPSARVYHKVSRSAPGIVSRYLLARNRLVWMHKYRARGERRRSYLYLAKELICALGALFGVQLSRHAFPRDQRRAVLFAWRDFILHRQGAWPPSLVKRRPARGPAAATPER